MRQNRKFPHIRYSQLIQTTLIVLVLLISLVLAPVQAQSVNYAPVAVDGRLVFRVSSNEQSKAQERANFISSQLQAVVKSDEAPDIKIEQRNNSPTIVVNGRYLLTVTQNDIDSAGTPEEQARVWVQKIEDAIQKAQSERGVNFIRNTSILSIVIVLMAIAVHRLVGIVWQLTQNRLSQMLVSADSSSDNQIQNTSRFLFKATLLLVRIGLWVGVVLYITNLFPITRNWSYNIAIRIFSSLTSPIFSLGQKSYSLTNILILIILLLGLIILAGTATNLLRSRILSRMRISRGAQEAIAIICKYAFISFGTIVLLQIWGLDLSSLTIVASALGVGIGFGFQDIAKNFGSGIVLLFERPIQVGDFIEVGEYMGTVEHIGARSVVIRTLDRISIIVPNSRFLETEVINWSHHNPVSRIHLPVGVAYGSDVNLVKTALIEATTHHSEVLKLPKPQVFFKEFGDSSLNFELLVWIDKPHQQAPIKSDIYFLIEASLRKHNIEVPFPQRDLNMRTGDLPIKFSPELEQALLRLTKGFHGNGKSVK
ncbi:MAG: mechanosensitive ion channel [Pelatocladus maniniholoensis HA4357-MV3]|jgi:potassium efflux system protein|uniref:Mechanosensitive ion channel n=1 Tax=Pelatocladus maniniholoensis HA4357-MV3 TaxID=1117104 RepID=A0A9E3H4F4_9NOST|nr:mechanosensitive ion channel [Pelatocladus maniniholoensis HA4357-MV3]BAZ69526.1 MscS mechanosensitive ion channel family protein [Fischerella sp. NIES-4106]